MADAHTREVRDSVTTQRFSLPSACSPEQGTGEPPKADLPTCSPSVFMVVLSDISLCRTPLGGDTGPVFSTYTHSQPHNPVSLFLRQHLSFITESWDWDTGEQSDQETCLQSEPIHTHTYYALSRYCRGGEGMFS